MWHAHTIFIHKGQNVIGRIVMNEIMINFIAKAVVGENAKNLLNPVISQCFLIQNFVPITVAMYVYMYIRFYTYVRICN